jgi:hypothetical protein
MTRRAIAVLLLLACGGAASGGDDYPGPDPGWCCDGLCGLSAEDSEAFDVCTCEASERATQGPGRGECLAGA